MINEKAFVNNSSLTEAVEEKLMHNVEWFILLGKDISMENPLHVLEDKREKRRVRRGY